MILAQLLADTVATDEPVLADFVRTMVEPFIVHHSLKSAKGGSDQNFGKNADQSMMTHIFNGLFPTMRLVALADRVRMAANTELWLDEIGQRLYMLGYAMHDVNKIRGMADDLDTSNRVKVKVNLDILNEELQRVNAAAFFPDYTLYLEDILFLVVNTQRREGANLSPHQFPGILHNEQLLLHARDLCIYSDSLAFFVKTPADVINGQAADKLKEIVERVSNNRFRFVYHQFSDVRGLLTGVINNAVKDWLAPEPEQEGAIGPFVPYLFFTRGVVYLQIDGKMERTLDQSGLLEAVELRLRAECRRHLNASAPGVSFNTKSNLSYPRYMEDLMKPVDFVQKVLINKCLRTSADITIKTRSKMQQMAAGQIPSGVNLKYSDDARIAIIGRFLLNFDKLIIASVEPSEQQTALRTQMYQHFGLTDLKPLADAIPSKGGLNYRYFWLGAEFMARHPGLAIEGEDTGSIYGFLRAFVATVAPLFVPGLEKRWQGDLLPQLRRYTQENLSFGGFKSSASAAPDFVAAFTEYTNAKRTPRATLPCTICNSPYLVDRKQTEADVLFQPWVYKNRLPLNAGMNAGGICAICLLELMLRQLKQETELRTTGTKFEDIKLKFLYLYPNYFFTTETSRFVRRMVVGLHDFNMFTVYTALASTALATQDYLALDMFALSDGNDNEPLPESIYRMEYSERDTQSLIFFAQRALGRKPTASETWAVPAILSLMLPMVLGCKVVVADSYLPLFAGAEEFQETVILDTAHPFLSYLLPSEKRTHERNDNPKQQDLPVSYTPAGRVRIDRVLTRLRLLTCVYSINYENFLARDYPWHYREQILKYPSSTQKPKREPDGADWNRVGRIARHIRTDPLNIFLYLQTQARALKAHSLCDGNWPLQAERYVDTLYPYIWEGLRKAIGGTDPMEVIKDLVEGYMVFYSPVPHQWPYQPSSVGITQPLSIATKVLLSRPREQVQSPDEYASDLKWMMRGELGRWLKRVRKGEASGRVRFLGKDWRTLEEQAVEAFVNAFYDKVYQGYCRGQAGLLNSRMNNIKSGCEAYYSANRAKWRRPRAEGESAEAVEEPTEASDSSDDVLDMTA